MSAVDGGHNVGGSPVVILLLGCRIRRVAALHVCDEECRVNLSKGSVSHSRAVLDGGTYRLVTRREGYPPHPG